jgi:hypothetical protein
VGTGPDEVKATETRGHITSTPKPGWANTDVGQEVHGRLFRAGRIRRTRVYADDFRQASERNAAVPARAAERDFGT